LESARTIHESPVLAKKGSEIMQHVRHSGYRQAQEAARYVTRQARSMAQPPRVGIILGSGLGGVVARIERAWKIPYKSIPHFPRTTVEGHAGILHLGFWGKIPVAVLEGRMHLYEGFTAPEVLFPARVLGLACVEVLVVTCAAGGISPPALPGSFMVLSDHLNLLGQPLLGGRHDVRWGPRFLDMREAYDPVLRQEARRAAKASKLKWFEGVYASVLGPQFETPAEVRALRRLGADAVGMSAVPDVLAARQMGVRVLAIAAITNRAAGLSRKLLTHEEVLEVGTRAGEDLARWLDVLLPRV
jgi:purine-nucleoside phosphorylase